MNDTNENKDQETAATPVKKNTAAVVLATWFGCGFAPIAPGTTGTLGAIPLYLIVTLVFHLPWWAYIIFTLALIAVAIWASDKAGKYFNHHDDKRIVIDEVAGYFVAAFALKPGLAGVVLAFLLFRLFDIVKLFPANFFDKKVKNAYGTVMDDVVAGIYSAIVAQIIGKLMAEAGWLPNIQY